MADISLLQSESWPNTVRSLLKDLGDAAGSHGLVIAMVPVGIVNGTPTLLATDDIQNMLAVISEVHREVHEGETFQTSRKSAEGADLADNATLAILIQVGANTLHLTWAAACGGDAEIEFLSGTVVSNIGTVLTFENMNRLFSGVTLPATSVSYDPTVTSAGTLLVNCLLAGGTGGNAAGGQARQDTEWILTAQANYLLRLTNRSGNAQAASLIVQGYEED